jgi:hypothetical protein
MQGSRTRTLPNLLAARFLIMVKRESALEIFCSFLDAPNLAESAGRLRADSGLSDRFCVDDSIDSMLQRDRDNGITIDTTYIGDFTECHFTNYIHSFTYIHMYNFAKYFHVIKQVINK